MDTDRYTVLSIQNRHFFQRLIQIPEDILDILDPDAQADEIRRDPGADLLLIRKLAVRGAGRMDRQRPGIADIGQVADQAAGC